MLGTQNPSFVAKGMFKNVDKLQQQKVGKLPEKGTHLFDKYSLTKAMPVGAVFKRIVYYYVWQSICGGMIEAEERNEEG